MVAGMTHQRGDIRLTAMACGAIAAHLLESLK
jgi:hypothetical protein